MFWLVELEFCPEMVVYFLCCLCCFSVQFHYFFTFGCSCKFTMKTENEDGSTIKSTMRYTFCAPGAIGKGRGRGLRSLITKGKTLTKSSLSSVYQPNDVVKQYIQEFETSKVF